MKTHSTIFETSRRGFTLIEVIISMGILTLLAGSVYAVVSASINASESAMTQQLVLRRLDAFERVTRDAFLNLPAEGAVWYEIDRSGTGVTEPRLVIDKPQEIFGLPSLAGGELVLAARAQADGTRTMVMLTVPANATDQQRKEAFKSHGIPLLPKMIKPRWTFKLTPQDEGWKEELPAESSKPVLIRLQMEISELPYPVEIIFYLPALTATPPPPTGMNGGTNNSTNQPPRSSPTPAP